MKSYASWRPFHDETLNDNNEKYIKFGIARMVCSITAIIFGAGFILALLCLEDTGALWVVPFVLLGFSLIGIVVSTLFRYKIGQKMGYRIQKLEKQAKTKREREHEYFGCEHMNEQNVNETHTISEGAADLDGRCLYESASEEETDKEEI